jgi:hypothetical protein
VPIQAVAVGRVVSSLPRVGAGPGQAPEPLFLAVGNSEDGSDLKLSVPRP